MPQEIKTTLDFKNVGRIVNLPDGVDPQDAATVHQLGAISGAVLPAGGTTGQIIKKQSNTDYDVDWEDAPLLAWGFGGDINDQTDLISGGKILPSLLPALAITDTYVVSSEAAMLALTVETGDIAIRTDETKTYILKGTDPSVLADWELLLTPTGGVVSVFGRSGAVTAQSGDYSFSLISGVVATAQGGAPAGGSTGYVLTKNSATDYDYNWAAASGSSIPYGSTTGSNSYSVTITGVSSLVTGQLFVINFTIASASSINTLNVNGLGAVPIKVGTSNAGKSLISANATLLQYDGSSFQIVSAGLSNIAYLNSGQIFTGNNIFTGPVSIQGSLSTTSVDYKSNLFIPSGGDNAQLNSSISLTGRNIWARVLLGNGQYHTNAVSNSDIAAVVITNGVTPSSYLGNTYPLVSSLMVQKPGTPSGTVTDCQAAYFDDAPTGGINNWSINAGKSKFRGTLFLSASSGAANSTPLKLTAGTNVSTPEDGAFEYDGTHLYFTIGTTRNILI